MQVLIIIYYIPIRSLIMLPYVIDRGVDKCRAARLSFQFGTKLQTQKFMLKRFHLIFAEKSEIFRKIITIFFQSGLNASFCLRITLPCPGPSMVRQLYPLVCTAPSNHSRMEDISKRKFQVIIRLWL